MNEDMIQDFLDKYVFFGKKYPALLALEELWDEAYEAGRYDEKTRGGIL